MIHESGIPKRLWVYNKETGSLLKKTLEFKEATHETWYQDFGGHNTYDPYYIDEDKDALVDRVHKGLATELQETLHHSEKLLNFIRKLTRKV